MCSSPTCGDVPHRCLWATCDSWLRHVIRALMQLSLSPKYHHVILTTGVTGPSSAKFGLLRACRTEWENTYGWISPQILEGFSLF